MSRISLAEMDLQLEQLVCKHAKRGNLVRYF